ncbi:MAG: ABC transporter ATP-binding protein, partial [Butyrivibrio sp.]|nr:ABC transporter ATP-binding protein [Butyrivibrio sp.]
MAEKVQEIRGPGGRNRGMPRPKIENPGKVFRRLMGYVFRYYGLHLVLVACCIVASVLANVQGTMFTRTLIDRYIEPLIGV